MVLQNLDLNPSNQKKSNQPQISFYSILDQGAISEILLLEILYNNRKVNC
jgi:hypothetical protein